MTANAAVWLILTASIMIGMPGLALLAGDMTNADRLISRCSIGFGVVQGVLGILLGVLA